MLGSYPLRRTPTRERQFRIVKWSPTIPPTSPHTDPQHGLDGVAIPGIGDGLMDSATRIQYIDSKLSKSSGARTRLRSVARTPESRARMADSP